MTQRSVLDALEARFPMLRGPSVTMRPSGDGRSSGSLPANRISPTSRTIDRCPMPWPRAGAAVDRRRHGRRVSRLLKRVASGGCSRDFECDVSQRRPHDEVHDSGQGDKEFEAGVMPTQELLTAMMQYNQALVDAGIMLAGGGCIKPQRRQVRFSGSKRVVTGGLSPKQTRSSQATGCGEVPIDG